MEPSFFGTDLFGTLASTGRSTTDLFVTLAAAGFVIGVLNATGLSFALTPLLVKIAGANLFLLLILGGTPVAIVYDAVTAFFGVYYVTVGIVGYFQRELGPLLRIAMFVAGAAAIVPDSAIGMPVPGLLSGVGVLAGGVILAIEYFSHRRAAPARGAAE